MTEHSSFPQPSSEAAEDLPDDHFDPFVPASGRVRHDGWTPERQRGFIAALREYGSVSRAARSVGKTKQSAYKLRTRPGAQDFATAWDRALSDARCHAFDLAVERATVGVWEPRFYRGQFIGLRHYADVRLAMAALRACDSQVWPKGDK